MTTAAAAAALESSELDMWVSRLVRDRGEGDEGSLESDHMTPHTGKMNVQAREKCIVIFLTPTFFPIFFSKMDLAIN